MRILWYSLTPSLATAHLTGKPGIANGWIESLQTALQQVEGVEMGVVFPWDTQQMMRFSLDKTEYFGYPQGKKGKIQQIVDRHSGKEEVGDKLDYYLQAIRDFQPDIIHIFGTEFPFGLLIPHTKVPALIWLQGLMTTIVPTWFLGMSKDDVMKYSSVKRKLKASTHFHKYLKAEQDAIREREILSYAKYLTGRTTWDKRISSVLAPQAAYFHCDEILRDLFYKDQWKPHTGRKKLVLLTTIQDNLFKGLDMVFRSAMYLQPILGNNFEWRIAGVSAEQHDLPVLMQKKYGKTAASLNIHLMGRIPGQALLEELLYADMYVHPSYIDNSPNSVCEAMLLGTPVVATNAGGIPDIIENKLEGFLVQAGDAPAMAGAILELYRNPALAFSFSKRARIRAKERHQTSAITDRLLAISKEILAGNAPKETSHSPSVTISLS